LAAENWIGGDFTGLQHMGSTLSGATTQMESVVKALDSGAGSLVSDAGWQGAAASSFRDAWTKDSVTAGGLSELVGSVAAILSSLGSTLSELNDALYSAYETARGQGVSVGPNGAPLPMLTGGGTPTAEEHKTIEANNDYTAVHKAITFKAQQARVQAAEALKQLHDEVDPEKPLGNADKASIGVLLRDLYASDDDRKSAAAEKANEEVSKARKARDAAKSALDADKAALADEGKAVPAELSTYKAYRSAVSEFVKSEQAASAIEDSRNAFSKLINFKAGDIEALSKAIEGFKYAPNFLKDVPVLDVAGALAGAGFEAKQDHDAGWSWTHSVLVDGGIALGGVVAGVGIGAAVAASLPEDVIALGGAAEAAQTLMTVGGAFAVGIGIDKAVHEHWSEDIHDHGVVGGITHGSWNALKSTGKTIKEDLNGFWHGIAGVF
jgi:uncharacterized protein YukE